MPRYYDMLKHRQPGATSKMRIFAKAISNYLKLETPNMDNFDETFQFIRNNITAYRREVVKRRVLGIGQSHLSLELKGLDIHRFTGIYIFWDNDEVVYIGKATVSGTRILSSYQERKLSSPITHVSVIKIANVADIHVLEPLLICENNPKLNKEFSCGRTPSMVSSNIDIHALKKIDLSNLSEEEENQLVQA